MVAKSVAVLDGVHLIACDDRRRNLCGRQVYWLDTPCPHWCAGGHRDGDMADDGTHFSGWNGVVLLTLEDGARMTSSKEHDELYQPEYVSVSLQQDVREVAAQIWCGKGESNTGWHMTAEEARELAAVLSEAAALADTATDDPVANEVHSAPALAAA
ncbi:DUF6907 domain-containing protein [Kutzneria kofuensis]|uniref:DUF6907 domain-containing protein n=1 Tax=Kutzneria kofuensis TaxID=103725 RepID=UPI0031F0537A